MRFILPISDKHEQIITISVKITHLHSIFSLKGQLSYPKILCGDMSINYDGKDRFKAVISETELFLGDSNWEGESPTFSGNLCIE